MAKKTFQDIVPPKKHSIRDIPIPEGRRRSISDDVQISGHKKAAPAKEVPPESEPKDVERDERPSWIPPRKEPPSDSESFEPQPRPRRRRYGLWILVFIVLIVLAFGISSLFASATVNVTQKSATAQITGTFTATKDSESGTVPFDVIKVSRNDSKVVAATGEKDVETKASGQITIYNNQSSAAQTLIKNTRFETPDGLIYRIADQISVPGQTTQNGQKIPGSLTVTVYADQVGPQYNIGLVDFTIPGFQGDPRYQTIYARSKTPMTGGASGTTTVASDEDKSQAVSDMQYELKQELLKDVQSQIPQDFTTFDNGLIYSFQDLPDTAGSASSSNSVTVNEQGSLSAVIINKKALGQIVADKFLSQFSGGDVEIANLPSLDLEFASSSSSFDPDTDQSFDFTLNGDANLIWQYDSDALKNDLLGVSRSDIDTIIAKYPSIQSADVIVRPFWDRNLPKDPQKIAIVNSASSTP